MCVSLHLHSSFRLDMCMGNFQVPRNTFVFLSLFQYKKCIKCLHHYVDCFFLEKIAQFYDDNNIKDSIAMVIRHTTKLSLISSSAIMRTIKITKNGIDSKRQSTYSIHHTHTIIFFNPILSILIAFFSHFIFTSYYNFRCRSITRKRVS